MTKKNNKNGRRAKRASRPAAQRPERQQDPRLVATGITAIGDEPASPGTWAVVVSPARMKDGEELAWYPPQPVAFALVTAKRFRDRGVKERLTIMNQLVRRDDGRLAPKNGRRTLDCLMDLHSAVLYAFTAVESLANHSIDQLDDTETVSIEFKKGVTTEVPKTDMVRRLNLDEKLSKIVPKLPDGTNIKGTRPWERYLHLKGLRDDLLHVKERGYSPNPDELTAYDRLILGDGDDCVKDAVAVVLGARPGFLPEHVVEVVDR